MAKFTQKIRVSNDCPDFITLMLEPWGEDYGMNPEDEFEIVAEDTTKTFYFHVLYNEKYISVYAEGDDSYPRVFQNGVELSCGHNRKDES